jgi:RNA polymerase sigma-70 factor (ECF subfamily)
MVLIASPTGQAGRNDADDPDLADRLLIEAHRAGDPSALGDLVRRHYSSLYHQARRLLLGREEAEDAVQETFLRALRALDHFGQDGTWRLGAWLHRILVHVCNDMAMQRARNTSWSTNHSLLDQPASLTDPSESVGDPVKLAMVREALATLPEAQRLAFQLRALDDLSYRAIANRLGISEDNARTRVQRARNNLRRRLGHVGALGTLVLTAPRRAGGLLLRALHLLHRPPSGCPGGSPGGRSSVVAGHVVAQSASCVGGGQASLVGTAAPIASNASAGWSPFIAQVMASPTVQSAVGALSAATPGKGSLLVGLAATLASASVLVMPARPARPARSTEGSRAPVSSRPVVTGSEDPSLHATPPSPGSSSSGNPSPNDNPLISPGSPSGGQQSSSASGSALASSSTQWLSDAPAWVLLAAEGTGTNSTTSPSTAQTLGSSNQANGLRAHQATAGERQVADTTTSGTSASAASAGSGTTAPPAPETGGRATSDALPPGRCGDVPGFTLATTPTVTPAIQSGELDEWVQTTPANLTSVGTQPTFSTVGWFGTSPTLSAVSNTLIVDAGTCFRQGGGLLAVDLTGPDGDVVQLVGTLVGTVGNDSTTPPSEPGTPALQGTFLFRGSVVQVGGTFVTGQPSLPWDLSPSFVAQLSLREPANTARLTIVFVQNQSSGVASDVSTTLSTSTTSSTSTHLASNSP